MKIADIVTNDPILETTSSAISVAPTAVGGMQKRNPDGTAKNALDGDTLMAGKKRKRKAKK